MNDEMKLSEDEKITSNCNFIDGIVNSKSLSKIACHGKMSFNP